MFKKTMVISGYQGNQILLQHTLKRCFDQCSFCSDMEFIQIEVE